jgi:hypothetical protein
MRLPVNPVTTYSTVQSLPDVFSKMGLGESKEGPNALFCYIKNATSLLRSRN